MLKIDLSENMEYNLFGKKYLDGALTKRAAWRARLIYFAVFIFGILPVLFDLSANLKVAGLGLSIPGGGFLALGGITATVGVVITWLVLLVSLILWWGTGNFIGPFFVWLASDLIAVLMIGERIDIWQAAPWLTIAIVALYALRVPFMKSTRLKKQLLLQEERKAYIPNELQEIKVLNTFSDNEDELELNLEELKAQKYIFDEAFQPYGLFKGYDDIEIFQPSAIRYQINQMQNTLAQIQKLYTPSFHGYSSQAQKKLIDSYTHKHVFDYWRYENFWGNLKFSSDPVPSFPQNIMLTGFYAINPLLYMKNTRDMSYTNPGSITFHYNKNTEYQNDIHTIVHQITNSWKQSKYTLYPCEPNWLYSACNWKAIQSVAAYDSLFGTHYIEENADLLLKKYMDELLWPSGTSVVFKSTRLGFNIMPISSAEVVMIPMYNVIIPRWAEETYTILRHENFKMMDGKLTYIMNGKGFDSGRYKPGHGSTIGLTMIASSEMGDTEAVKACMEALYSSTKYSEIDGGIRWDISNEANAGILQGMINVKNGWRKTVLDDLPEHIFKGPILSDVKYPDVLVAKAVSDGSDLNLVLYPGKERGLQRITIDRLRPNASYRILGDGERVIQSDAMGQTSIIVSLEGRTTVRIVPNN